LPEEVALVVEVVLLVQRLLIDLARTSFILELKMPWWLEMKGSRKARMVMRYPPSQFKAPRTLAELVLVAPSISSGCMAELGSSSLNHEGVGVGLTLVLPSEHGIAASNVQYSKL